MKYFYLKCRLIQTCLERIHNYILHISYRFLNKHLYNSYWIELFLKKLSVLFGLTSLKFLTLEKFLVVFSRFCGFHVRKWTALIVSKLYHLTRFKMRIAQREQIMFLGNFVFNLQRKFTLEYLPTMLSQLWTSGAN